MFISVFVLSVTLKDNKGQKCLNPESRFAQNYIKSAVANRYSIVLYSQEIQDDCL